MRPSNIQALLAIGLVFVDLSTTYPACGTVSALPRYGADRTIVKCLGVMWVACSDISVRIFPQMQPHVCIANRNSYTFPPAHLLRISAAVPGSVTWAGRHYQPYPSGRSGIVATSLALDNFHRVLLNSATSDDRVDGVVSVVYWGNSAGANGARTGLGLPRAKWILEGKVRDRLVMRPTPALTIANTVEAARIRIHAGDSAAALSLLQGISFLGWSFASKVAAFLDPTHCGVLDKVIARHL